MALKDTIQKMKALLALVSDDLDKSVSGNKAAAQRARTATITLAKISKTFRKESIASEKKSSKPKAKPSPKSSPQVKRPTAKIPARRK